MSRARDYDAFKLVSIWPVKCLANVTGERETSRGTIGESPTWQNPRPSMRRRLGFCASFSIVPADSLDENLHDVRGKERILLDHTLKSLSVEPGQNRRFPSDDCRT